MHSEREHAQNHTNDFSKAEVGAFCTLSICFIFAAFHLVSLANSNVACSYLPVCLFRKPFSDTTETIWRRNEKWYLSYGSGIKMFNLDPETLLRVEQRKTIKDPCQVTQRLGVRTGPLPDTK